jgi:hypothetical protein
MFFGCGGSITLVSCAGDTNDTTTKLSEEIAQTGSRLWLHQINLVSGLDANIVYDLSGGFRSVGYGIAISGTAGLDANASNPAKNRGVSVGAPVAASFTIDVSQALILAFAMSTGAHLTNLPAPPSGYTIIGTVLMTGSANNPTNTALVTGILCRRTTAGAAGSIASATFTGWTDIGANQWGTIHAAFAPA